MLIIWNPTNKASKLRGQDAVIFFKVKGKIKEVSQATKEYTVNLHSKLKRSMIKAQLHRDGLVDEILLRVVIKKSNRSKTLRHNMDVHSNQHYPRHNTSDKENQKEKENTTSDKEKEKTQNIEKKDKKSKKEKNKQSKTPKHKKSKFRRKGKGRKSSNTNTSNNNNNNQNDSENEIDNRNKRRRKTRKPQSTAQKKNFAFDEGMICFVLFCIVFCIFLYFFVLLLLCTRVMREPQYNE